MSGDSSSSTFHDFIILSYSKIKKWGRSAKSQNPNPHGFAYITNNLDFSCFDLFLMMFYLLFMKTWKVEDEESPEIHFAGGISRKTWIWISFRSKNMKRNFANFSIFGQGNPYHQSDAGVGIGMLIGDRDSLTWK